MKATLREGHAPVLVVALDQGEKLVSEAGAMMFMSGQIERDIEMPGGITDAAKRKLLAGESLFFATYTAHSAGAVGLTGPFPGSIREHQLEGEIICEKHAYLGHHGEVTVEHLVSKKAGMGFTGGGEGFFLQKISGSGTVWLHGGGDFVDFDLVEGQMIQVDTGCMVMFEPTVAYDVKMQSGVKKAIFGGEGLFMVEMTGPGHVTLQTLPFSRTAQAVMEAAGGGQGERSGGGPGGMLGGILGT